MTQFMLARKSLVSPSRISFIENGYVKPKPEERDRLARALRADVAEVFPGVVVANHETVAS